MTKRSRFVISIWLISIMEHLLKSAAMRSDGEVSCEELEKELLECLAMIDQQNRKEIGNLTPCQTKQITSTTNKSPFTRTRSPGVMTRVKGGCALSVKRTRRRREKCRMRLRRLHLMM